MLIMLLALFLVTMFLGTPIAFSMSFASIVTNLTHGASSLMLTAQQCYDSTSNLSLLAVPFFMLAGSIMNMGGISRRLINFCRLFVGRIRGGLAIVAVLAAMIFAAISGSGPATVAALGVFMIPAMVNDGYDVGFAGALMGSAGGLGIIIPPSIPMVIYATLAGCSVGTMFCAGIVPGIILGLAMMIYAYIIARRNGYKPAPVDAPTFKDKAKVFADGLPAIAMPVIILGGIYSGIFTPTQASGIANYNMNGENTCYKQSVTAVVLRDNKVLLARHTYGAGKDFLIVPGGYLNLDETPEDAVKREFLEETGVVIEPKNIIAVRFNLKDWYVAFSADYVSGREHSDNDENSEVLWLDVDEALNRSDVPELTKKLLMPSLSIRPI